MSSQVSSSRERNKLLRAIQFYNKWVEYLKIKNVEILYLYGINMPLLYALQYWLRVFLSVFIFSISGKHP